MTKQDYLDWAEDYRRQSDILAEKIKRQRELMNKPFPSAKARSDAEQYLENLIEMRLDDICVMKNLLKWAEKMKE